MRNKTKNIELRRFEEIALRNACKAFDSNKRAKLLKEILPLLSGDLEHRWIGLEDGKKEIFLGDLIRASEIRKHIKKCRSRTLKNPSAENIDRYAFACSFSEFYFSTINGVFKNHAAGQRGGKAAKADDLTRLLRKVYFALEKERRDRPNTRDISKYLVTAIEKRDGEVTSVITSILPKGFCKLNNGSIVSISDRLDRIKNSDRKKKIRA